MSRWMKSMDDLKRIIEALAELGYVIFEHKPSEKYEGGLDLEIVRSPTNAGDSKKP
ncbi:MAG: hypothetical protein LBF87_01905 [Treponema sp.]|jgi:hypothetical protein|nr:hypothetical protein [Treponema sp.]